MTFRSRCMAVLSLALALAGCQTDESWEVPTGVARGTFEQDVYPVLIRDCGFHTCHGGENRFFRIWGPGRVRLGNVGALDELLETELEQSYRRSISFIDRRDPSRSLLLRKPLAVEAGGAGHLGIDKFGRNVYRTQDSPGYLTLSRWVYGVMRPK
ncbi:MAG: hypothetical protein ABW321_20535 [Polyangiales bacterium]